MRKWGFPGGSVVKNPPANSGDIKDVGLISGSGRAPAGGHGSPLQYSCLEDPRNRGAWRATVHGVAKNQTGLRTAQHSTVIDSWPARALHPAVLQGALSSPGLVLLQSRALPQGELVPFPGESWLFTALLQVAYSVPSAGND